MEQATEIPRPAGSILAHSRRFVRMEVRAPRNGYYFAPNKGLLVTLEKRL